MTDVRIRKPMTPERRAIVKGGYSQYADHILESVISQNRLKWSARAWHPIMDEQLEIADIAEEILAERAS